jgi:hypothetical protein
MVFRSRPSAAIIRSGRGCSTGFFEGELTCNEIEMLVLRGPADGQKCNGYNHTEHSREHQEDEPRSPICGLGGGLGDAHGVDEGVRDEEEELHVD